MRLRVAALLLTGVASFSLAACNDNAPGDNTQVPMEIEVDFDSATKTKTVVVPPPTLPTYRSPATSTTKRPAQLTTPKPTRR